MDNHDKWALAYITNFGMLLHPGHNKGNPLAFQDKLELAALLADIQLKRIKEHACQSSQDSSPAEPAWSAT